MAEVPPTQAEHPIRALARSNRLAERQGGGRARLLAWALERQLVEQNNPPVGRAGTSRSDDFDEGHWSDY